MKVAVTGGTGFVGSHTVQALLEAGHEVRLLVRDLARVPRAFEPLGVDAIDDIVVGDVTSPVDVETLLEGCEAVVHAASIYSLDIRDAAAIRATNVAGTKLILETARRLGLDPIIHVSSIAALIPTDRPLDSDSPVATEAAGVYGQSKAETEALARQYQDEGVPVVTVMPAAVWGPHDPHFGESNRIAADFLRGRLRMLPRGGSVGVVDVRDVASVIAGAMQPGMGARRYALSPHNLPLANLAGVLNRVTGRRIRTIALPDGVVRAAVAPASLIQRLLPVRLPFNTESINGALGWAPVDSSRAAEDLGLEYRSVDETFADTITAMVEDGDLAAKHAGDLVSTGS